MTPEEALRLVDLGDRMDHFPAKLGLSVSSLKESGSTHAPVRGGDRGTLHWVARQIHQTVGHASASGGCRRRRRPSSIPRRSRPIG
jgi:hypothetical protein